MDNKDYHGHMREQEKEHEVAHMSCSYSYYKEHVKDKLDVKLKYIEDSRIDYKKNKRFCELVSEFREVKDEIRIKYIRDNENISNEKQQ